MLGQNLLYNVILDRPEPVAPLQGLLQQMHVEYQANFV